MNKTSITILVLPLLACFLFQCQKPPRSCTLVKLENSINQKREIVNLSSICKSVSYIKLETNPNCVIEHISKVFIDKQFVFIMDRHKVLAFDTTGKFLNQIGTIGRGPGEYTMPSDICINTHKEEVYILDRMTNKIIAYDYFGSFKKASGIQPFLKIGIIDNEFLAGLFPTRLLFESNYLLIETLTSKFEHYSYLLDISSMKINPQLPGYLFDQFYYYENKLTYWEYFDYTIYRIPSPDVSVPILRFELGKFQFPFKKLLTASTKEESIKYSENPDKFFYLSRVLESKDHFFLSGSLQRHLELYTVDKETLKSQRLEFIPDFQSAGFFNDIDGGSSFWPMGTIDKNTLYKIIEVSTLLKESKSDVYADKIFKQEKFNIQIDSTMIDDNPWIMIVTLKDI